MNDLMLGQLFVPFWYFTGSLVSVVSGVVAYLQIGMLFFVGERPSE